MEPARREQEPAVPELAPVLVRHQTGRAAHRLRQAERIVWPEARPISCSNTSTARSRLAAECRTIVVAPVEQDPRLEPVARGPERVRERVLAPELAQEPGLEPERAVRDRWLADPAAICRRCRSRRFAKCQAAARAASAAKLQGGPVHLRRPAPFVRLRLPLQPADARLTSYLPCALWIPCCSA